jgi:hypothetical protein
VGTGTVLTPFAAPRSRPLTSQPLSACPLASRRSAQAARQHPIQSGMVAMRELAKKLMRATRRLLVLPLAACYVFESRVFDRDRTFQAYSRVIAFIKTRHIR